MPTLYSLVSRSWQWRCDLVHHEAVWSSESTPSRESINVKTVNYFTVHQSMSGKWEFLLWRGAPSAVTDSSFLYHEFIALESVFIYLFFLSPPFQSPAGLCKASGRTCLCCYETRFQTLSTKLFPTWVWSQTCGAPGRTQIWSCSAEAALRWLGSWSPPLQFLT